MKLTAREYVTDYCIRTIPPVALPFAQNGERLVEIIGHRQVRLSEADDCKDRI